MKPLFIYQRETELDGRLVIEKLDDCKKAEMFKILGMKQTEIIETEHL